MFESQCDRECRTGMKTHVHPAGKSGEATSGTMRSLLEEGHDAGYTLLVPPYGAKFGSELRMVLERLGNVAHPIQFVLDEPDKMTELTGYLVFLLSRAQCYTLHRRFPGLMVVNDGWVLLHDDWVEFDASSVVWGKKAKARPECFYIAERGRRVAFALPLSVGPTDLTASAASRPPIDQTRG